MIMGRSRFSTGVWISSERTTWLPWPSLLSPPLRAVDKGTRLANRVSGRAATGYRVAARGVAQPG
jgi:hypothetical protein